MFSRKGKPAPLTSDVAEVTDVTEVSVVETVDATPAATAGEGIFLSAKPTEAAQGAKAGATASLRERFRRTPAPSPADAVSDAKPAKKSLFKWRKTASQESASAGEAAPAGADSAHGQDAGPVGPTQPFKKPIIVRRAVEKKRKFQELPIRVLIGYLPEVTERDARDYALGIAERNCDQLSLSYFDAFKLKNGYAYEIHEGGPGRAYLPSIIENFSSLGTFEKGAATNESIYIRTATRTVQVDRTRDGLQAFLLPENSTEPGTEWLSGTAKMTPAVPTMTALLVVGAVLFTTGFLTLTLALSSRIQPYDPPLVPKVEKATDAFAQSPLSQWSVLQNVTGSEYVKALRYSNGKWKLDRESSAEATESPAPAEPIPSTTN